MKEERLEQLKKVFTKEIKSLLERFELTMRFNTLISPDELIEKIVSKLLYEVKIRINNK